MNPARLWGRKLWDPAVALQMDMPVAPLCVVWV